MKFETSLGTLLYFLFLINANFFLIPFDFVILGILLDILTNANNNLFKFHNIWVTIIANFVGLPGCLLSWPRGGQGAVPIASL